MSSINPQNKGFLLSNRKWKQTTAMYHICPKFIISGTKTEALNQSTEWWSILDYSMVQFMFLPFCSHLGTDIVHVHSLC